LFTLFISNSSYKHHHTVLHRYYRTASFPNRESQIGVSVEIGVPNRSGISMLLVQGRSLAELVASRGGWGLAVVASPRGRVSLWWRHPGEGLVVQVKWRGGT